MQGLLVVLMAGERRVAAVTVDGDVEGDGRRPGHVDRPTRVIANVVLGQRIDAQDRVVADIVDGSAQRRGHVGAVLEPSQADRLVALDDRAEEGGALAELEGAVFRARLLDGGRH